MSKKKNARLDYDRDSDGVDYIAISSKARTRLGRALATGGHLPFEHRDYGHFNSVAGLIRFLGGDHREINREISGVEYDDAITDRLGDQYEEVLQDHLRQALHSLAFLKADIQMAAHNQLDFIVFHNVDDDWVQLEKPLWLAELIQDLLKSVPVQGSGPKTLDWDPAEIQAPVVQTPQRTLLELQAAWLEAKAGTNEMIDFLVSQEEYDSIPEHVRTMMGETLKLQRAIDGTAVPAPPKKIM
ncbi:hypothetical protein [Xanthomonas phage RTH11]|nr:hypothetical protein [Xanthomonas phage RTH11]